MKTILKKSMAMVLVVLMALSCCAISSFAAVSEGSFSIEKIALPETVVGHGHTNDIAIYGNYLYVFTRSSALKIYDITNIESPTLVYTMGTSLYGEGMTDKPDTLDIYGDKLFMSFQDNKVRMFSLENPASPDLVSTFTLGAQKFNMEVDANGTFWASGHNSTVWKQDNVASITEEAVTLGTGNGSNNFRWYEAANGLTSRFRNGNLISSANGAGANEMGLAYKAFASAGDYMYVLRDNTLDVVNVASGEFKTNYNNAANKKTIDITSLNFDETAVGVYGATSNNHIIFFSANGLLVFDVTDPANPVNVPTDVEGVATSGVATKGDYIFTAQGNTISLYKTTSNSISMQRQAATFAPTLGTSINLSSGERTSNIVSYGDYLYFGTTGDNKGLIAYNVKDGNRTTLNTGRIDPNGHHTMILDGTDLYVALANAAGGYIKVYDVSSNPANPTLKAGISTAVPDAETGTGSFANMYGAHRGMAVAGGRFYSFDNNAYFSLEIPVTGNTTCSRFSTGNLSNYARMLHGNDKNLYTIVGTTLYDHVIGRAPVSFDSAAYSVYTNAGYLYVLKDDALKVVNEDSIYADGVVSSDLYEANGTTVTFTGIDENVVYSEPVIWDNYLIYAADKLLVFDITNPAAPVQVNVNITLGDSSSAMTGLAVNGNKLYATKKVASGYSIINVVNLGYQIEEVASTEITSLPVTFAGTASGVANITLTVGSDEYTVPVVDGKWSKTITEVSDANGEIEVTATAGISSVSADYTLNLPVEEPAELAVSVTYTDTFNATVTIENNNENKAFMVILVVYNGNAIYDVDYEVISATDTLSCVAPEGDVSGYTAKTFVWSDIMVPFLANPAVR